MHFVAGNSGQRSEEEFVLIEIDPNSGDNRRRTLGTVMRFACLEPYQQQHYTTPLAQIEPLVAQIVESYRLVQVEQANRLMGSAKRLLEATLHDSAACNTVMLQATIDAHTFISKALMKWHHDRKEAKVGIYREPQRMSLEELLSLLVEEPDRMEWLAPAITTRVRGAMAITPRWVRLTKFGGTLDIDKTVVRVTKLEQGGQEWAEHHNPALRQPVCTLDEALGLKPRTILPL